MSTILNLILLPLALFVGTGHAWAAAAASNPFGSTRNLQRAQLLQTLARSAATAKEERTWMESLDWLEQKITVADGNAYDTLGSTIAIDGTTAFVSAPNHPAADGANGFQGSVYVFRYAAGS